MTRDIRRIVRQRAQSEGVLVGILGLEQQLANEVAATDVMHQVAEFPAAERVVAKILDNGATVRVGMRLPDLVFRQSRISLEQEGLDLIGPEQVYDLLVRQNGVCERGSTAHQQNDNDCQRTDIQDAPLVRDGAWRWASPLERHACPPVFLPKAGRTQ